jgi:hypothetical protein
MAATQKKNNSLDSRTKVLFLFLFISFFGYGSYYLGNLLMDDPGVEMGKNFDIETEEAGK